ncbi:cGMP-dependent protein kinase 1-like isoform X5 [Bolinopsis microptera]|uniref:cGMP-dependent protein kinase 1-like isoform X5 n=1 Tax=Bolinopsis microptera TaxID=2820187 RepID=UPI003078CC25
MMVHIFKVFQKNKRPEDGDLQEGAGQVGNGSGQSQGVYDMDAVRAKVLVPELRTEIKDCYVKLKAKDQKIQDLETEVNKFKSDSTTKADEITRLKDEINKLRDVLGILNKSPAKQQELLDSIKEVPAADQEEDVVQEVKPPPQTQQKRQRQVAISGESVKQSDVDIDYTEYPKDADQKAIIKAGILKNDFMKNLEHAQIREIVACMKPDNRKAGEWIIKEGEPGQTLFALQEGQLEVIKNSKVLTVMGPGRVFGELAILYNCTRTASIRALTDCKLWELDRTLFQAIMMKTGQAKQKQHLDFLKSVKLLQDVPEAKLVKIADALEEEIFKKDEYIIRQGSHGETFYIMVEGEVLVTAKLQNDSEASEIRTLTAGAYFGERALLGDDKRTANIIAKSEKVSCLVVDRASFKQLIGSLEEFKHQDEKYKQIEKKVADNLRESISSKRSQPIAKTSDGGSIRSSSPEPVAANEEYANLKYEDLKHIATLGMGGFGRVELVCSRQDKTKSFALKCLKKKHIVDTKQQDHIVSEKNLLLECKSLFITRLYRTYRDRKYVYMLMEVCLGGELWTIMRDRGCFDNNTTKFFVACVVEAFDYLHRKGIVYRDLKPENLLLDSEGYVKLCDFGFGKKIGHGRKTWTFCGTPEYVAPEIILNKGHDLSADYWSLGILMFELLTGSPPFSGADPMQTYNLILRGMDMVEFPRKINKSAQHLVKKLCRDNPAERIGYQRDGLRDIKKHKWYQGFDWEGLINKRVSPPISPRIKNATDSSNFDSYPKDNEEAPDEMSGWDADF